jgi:hypothetical protein
MSLSYVQNSENVVPFTSPNLFSASCVGVGMARLEQILPFLCYPTVPVTL